MLDSWHIRNKRLSKQLDHKTMGLFCIKKAFGNRVFRLELPSQMKVYLAYHIGLMEHYRGIKDTTRIQIVPEVEKIDRELNW